MIAYKAKHSRFRPFSDKDSENIRLLLYALIIGLSVGVVGALFRLTLNYIEKFRGILFGNAGHSGFTSWLWPVLFAVAGISIALFLVKKYAPEASGSGVQEIEGALDGIRPMRWKRVLPVKFIASLFSLGSGLLLGREGPTIQLGANIGHMFKDLLRLPDSENNPLVSAGAAAGLSCAFNAPFAGIIFVIEEMHEHFRFKFYSVAAIMIGAGASDFVVRALISPAPIIEMTIFPGPGIRAQWLFILFGLVLGALGYVFNKSLIVSLDYFKRLSKYPIILTGAIAGITIAVIGIFFPVMIGGGYGTITEVFDHSFTLKFMVILFLVRMVLSIFSYATGVSGGIFVPMLTLGVMIGWLFGSIMQHYFPDLVVHPGIFSIAGMAGIFASTVRAPITGMVLAVEMTSNFELILPLIITTVIASVFTTLLGNRPIYESLLKRTLSSQEPTSGSYLKFPAS